MTHTLLRKELRELLPWAILGLAIAVMDLAEQLVEQLDMLPLGQTSFFLHDADTALYWLIAFAIGTGLATREHDDGTLAFLDGLPVSRTHSFFVKAGVMAVLVLIPPVCNTLTVVGMHLLSRGSLDEELHAALLGKAFALQSLLVVNGLFLGAALGRLRSLTWLALGVSAIALQLLGEILPRVALFNPLSLLNWQWSSADLHVDPEAVWVQGALAAGAFLLAWRGFVRAGRAQVISLANRPVLGAFVTIATIGVGFAALVVLTGGTPPQTASEGGEQRFEFVDSPPAQSVTEHYRFSYPQHEAEAARELVAQADAIFERVHELMGVPLGERIDVDASGSIRGTHGTAYYDRLQMTLDSEVAPVLAHETAHVVASRMAGAQSAWLWDHAVVLNEGLASWVEAQFRARSSREERAFVLAALHTRRELLVEELASPALLGQLRDENLKYAAGEAIIAAVIRLYGEEAIPRLLAAFADPRLPTDLRGLPLWQGTFQLADMNVSAVLDEFYREVEATAQRNADGIARLPRPRIRIVTEDGFFGVVPVVDTGGGRRIGIVLRIKPEPDSPSHQFRQLRAVPGMVTWLRRGDIATGRVCAQPGVRVGEETLFEPWVCLPTSDAEPIETQ